MLYDDPEESVTSAESVGRDELLPDPPRCRIHDEDVAGFADHEIAAERRSGRRRSSGRRRDPRSNREDEGGTHEASAQYASRIRVHVQDSGARPE